LFTLQQQCGAPLVILVYAGLTWWVCECSCEIWHGRTTRYYWTSAGYWARWDALMTCATPCMQTHSLEGHTCINTHAITQSLLYLAAHSLTVSLW